jgi:hypothetical protein
LNCDLQDFIDYPYPLAWRYRVGERHFHHQAVVLDVLGGDLTELGTGLGLAPFNDTGANIADLDRDGMGVVVYMARMRRYFASSGTASAKIALFKSIIWSVLRPHE